MTSAGLTLSVKKRLLRISVPSVALSPYRYLLQRPARATRSARQPATVVEAERFRNYVTPQGEPLA